MRIHTLIIIAIIYRLTILMIQRSLGMEWDFHIDATFYVNRITELKDQPLLTSLAYNGAENFFYIFIGYLLQNSTFDAFKPQTTLISLNLISSALLIWLINKISNSTSNQKASMAAFFVAGSPYLAHLSIHPLKDTIALLISTCFLLSIIRKRWFFAFVFSAALIATRFHLGIITAFIIFSWSCTHKINLGRWKQIFIIAMVMISFYLIAYEQLNQRLEVEFEGRDFYPNGLALVPENLALRFFLGGFFNFLVPFPFIPSGSADIGYFPHLLFFLSLLLFKAKQNKKPSESITNDRFGLILCSLFLFAFILTTTPGAGPLVRYRLFTEILLLIALSGPLNWHTKKFRSTHKKRLK